MAGRRRRRLARVDARGHVVTVVTRLRVSVRVPGDEPMPSRGTVRVSVEDVSRADAPAPQLAAAAFPSARPAAGMLGPFELTAELLPGAHYAVRVHLDRSGDGRIAAGDLVSVARQPVEAAGEVELEVPVRPVPADLTS